MSENTQKKQNNVGSYYYYMHNSIYYTSILSGLTHNMRYIHIYIYIIIRVYNILYN